MGERQEVKLLGTWYSPVVARAKIALRLKSVDYDYFEEDLWFPTLIATTITKSENAKAKGMDEVGEGLLLLEDAFISISKGKRFFGGEVIGFMDICLGSFLVILKAREKLNGENILDKSKTPSLCKWANEFLADDTVKNVVPEIDRVVKFKREFN
uniref:Glutathione S-transferase n=1 Tax=Brassica campestris TaxID=3711 RepID=M4EGC8_BRACM